MKFSLGQSEHERIELEVLRYERAAVGEYYDDNWLTSQIGVRAGRFRGKVDAAVLTGELASFLTSLRPLYDTLRGTAEFSTMEEQLHAGEPALELPDLGDRADGVEHVGVHAFDVLYTIGTIAKIGQLQREIGRAHV